MTPDRPPLTTHDHLSVYWDNHLRVAFEQSVAHDIPAMVEASLAHVQMLAECGSLPAERADRLLGGLHTLWAEYAAGREREYPFDGSVEDPYYFLEARLAEACGIATSELDVQLARSRNDLDAGVFRMVLRADVLDLGDVLLQLVTDTCDRAYATRDAVIIGHTHRRPAQPTTLGHVLAGLAEALISQAAELVSVFDELNVSPLGAAAFTGTDITIDPERVAELLGFDRAFSSSYEAVAGAEHFLRLAALHARITATGARWARVLLEWMTFGWVTTPLAYTQGSSIMPQKVNPVVLEHLVSYQGATAADMSAVFANIGSGWYEDSNNATTDVQQHLWRSSDRVLRFVRLVDGLMTELEVGTLPTREQIVASGATTTAVAEALAAAGVSWRAAHHAVGTLVRERAPLDWDAELVRGQLAAAGIDETHVDLVLASGQHPERIRERTQVGSPGEAAVARTVECARSRCAELREALSTRRANLDRARDTLLNATRREA